VALFRKKKGQEQSKVDSARPLVSRPSVFCRVCNAYRPFTRCWMRTAPVQVCTSCGAVFEDPAKLYDLHLPACPRCGEYIEHPGFEYGLCDACGSKYEIVEGAKPGLLPNKRQRDAMDLHGKARSHD
jgi:predicted RNA-binding Zn-ribbon protein involved in translation (DUF1610 family)